MATKLKAGHRKPNRITCNIEGGCNREFTLKSIVIKEEEFESAVFGDINLKYFRCPKCGIPYRIAWTDRRIAELQQALKSMNEEMAACKRYIQRGSIDERTKELGERIASTREEIETRTNYLSEQLDSRLPEYLGDTKQTG